MQSTKFVTLLRTLDDKELKSFSKYLSTLYGKHKASMTLFQYIKKFSSVNYEHKRLDKVYIQKKVLKVENERRVSNEASQLYEWLNEFLVWNKLKQEDYKIRYQQLLLEEYRERGLEKLADKTLSNIQEALNETIKQPSDYLYEIDMYHQAYFLRLNDLKILDSANYEKGLNRLQEVLKIYQLKYTCEAISRHFILKEPVRVIPITNVSLHSVLGKMYELLYEAYSSMEEEKFNKADEFFQANYQKIPASEQSFILGILTNIVANWLKQGKLEFRLTLHNLYEFGLDTKILIQDNFITDTTFFNIANTAIALKKIDYVENFTTTYASYLKEESREMVVALVKGYIAFAKEDYQKAIIPNHSLFKYPLYELQARILSLCASVELLEDYDTIEKKRLAFKQKLNREKDLNPTYRAAYRNFMEILSKLLDETERKEVIMEMLSSKKLIYMKSWLLKKLQMYKANKYRMKS